MLVLSAPVREYVSGLTVRGKSVVVHAERLRSWPEGDDRRAALDLLEVVCEVLGPWATNGSMVNAERLRS
jgi:hypothetical protein